MANSAEEAVFWCPPGEWKGVRATSPEECIPCIISEWCLGSNNTCAHGRDGFACGSCSPNYFSYEDGCHECPSETMARTLYAVCVFLCLLGVYVLYRLSDNTMDVTTLGIGTAHFQMTFVYFQLGIEVPNRVHSFMDAFGVVFGYVFEIIARHSGPECVLTSVEIPYPVWWICNALLPIFLCLPFIAGIVRSKFRHKKKKKASADYIESIDEYDERRARKRDKKRGKSISLSQTFDRNPP